MANNDVTTKAPESDAKHKTIIPEDSPAQEGGSMGVSNARKATAFAG